MKIRSFLAVLAFLALAPPALAQSLPLPLLTGPQDVSQMQTILNTLISEINAVLVPTFPAAPGAVNFTTMQGGLTGQPAQIGLMPGGDANAGIFINPNGSGDVILFGPNDTGTLMLGNAASFISAPDLTACPSRAGARSQLLGIHSTVQGMFVFDDWLGIPRGVPVC